eukprot:13738487-Ditylum_brightwellii.AAC.1
MLHYSAALQYLAFSLSSAEEIRGKCTEPKWDGPHLSQQDDPNLFVTTEIISNEVVCHDEAYSP